MTRDLKLLDILLTNLPWHLRNLINNNRILEIQEISVNKGILLHLLKDNN